MLASCVRPYLLFLCVCPSSLVLCADEHRAPDSATPMAVAPDRAIVVRFSADLFRPEEGSKVDNMSPVNVVILGNRVTGTCRTVGEINVDFLHDNDDASFQLVFDGACYSRTVSQSGPARVHNSSRTNFRCVKRVSFDLERGFHAAPSRVATSTQLWNDRIETSRRGLIGRVVRNVASRRVAETLPQARQVSDQDTRRDIARGFDQAIDQQLVALNRRMDTTRVLAALLGAATQRTYCVRSNAKYIEICFNDSKLGDAEYLTIPDDKVADAPIEVWASSSLFDSKLRTMITALSLAGNVLQRLSPDTNLPETLGLIGSSVTPKEVSVVDGWFVFALNPEKPLVALASAGT